VLGFCVLFLAARTEIPSLLSFLRGLVPLAAPAIVYMATHNSLAAGQFLAWQPGFDGGATNPLGYWLQNAGVFLPLVALGIVCSKGPSPRRFAWPFLILFLVANLFRLSPWIWDNMKFMAPAHAGLASFAALALAWLWGRGRAGRTAALLAFGTAVLSGALDLSKVAFNGEEYRVFSPTDLVFAKRVREATPGDATLLTAPIHNHPVLLSGRRVFLGYEGHLWSQGLDYAGRKKVAEALFRGGSQATLSPQFVRVDALSVTPAELPLIPDPAALDGLPSLVDSPYRLVKAR
jgi:hypothetical protein